MADEQTSYSVVMLRKGGMANPASGPIGKNHATRPAHVHPRHLQATAAEPASKREYPMAAPAALAQPRPASAEPARDIGSPIDDTDSAGASTVESADMDPTSTFDIPVA